MLTAKKRLKKEVQRATIYASLKKGRAAEFSS